MNFEATDWAIIAVNDPANQFLKENPLVEAAMWVFVALLLGGFGIYAVTTKKLWTKFGRKLEGNTAFLSGIGLLIAASIALMLGMFAGGKGLVKLLDDDVGESDVAANGEISNNRNRQPPVPPTPLDRKSSSSNKGISSASGEQTGGSQEEETVDEDMEAIMARHEAMASGEHPKSTPPGFRSVGTNHPANSLTTAQPTEPVSFEAGEATDLGTAEFALPPLRYTPEKADMSEVVGFELKGHQFINQGPSGSLLVGFRIGLPETENRGIGRLRPIYQLEDRYYYGNLIGAPGDESQLILADPGYVIGGINVSSSIAVESIQAIFLKMDPETAKLDQVSRYLSDGFGEVRGREETIYANGWHIIGLFGREDDSVRCIGLAALSATVDTTTSAGNHPYPFRTWISTDGQFRVEARFVEMQDGKVVLMKRDEQILRVSPDDLSDDDRQWLTKNK